MINRQIRELQEKIRKNDLAINSDFLTVMQYYKCLSLNVDYKENLKELEKTKLRIEKLERITHDNSTNK